MPMIVEIISRGLWTWMRGTRRHLRTSTPSPSLLCRPDLSPPSLTHLTYPSHLISSPSNCSKVSPSPQIFPDQLLTPAHCLYISTSLQFRTLILRSEPSFYCGFRFISDSYATCIWCTCLYCFRIWQLTTCSVVI